MKSIKILVALMLTVLMMFSICACGSVEDQTGETTDTQSTDTETTGTETDETTANTTADDGKVTYTVTVVDVEGNAVAGAMVQLCLEACVPRVTDANGVATFELEEADYKISFVTMPEGYTCDENEFHFAEGSYEITLTLKTQ